MFPPFMASNPPKCWGSQKKLGKNTLYYVAHNVNFSPKCWGSQKKLGSGMVPSSLHSYTEAKATFIIKKKAERQVSNEENSSLNLLKLLFEIRQFQQHVWAFYERLKKHVFSQTFSCSILIESFSENRVFFPFFVKVKSSVKVAQILVMLTFTLWLLSEPVFSFIFAILVKFQS